MNRSSLEIFAKCKQERNRHESPPLSKVARCGECRSRSRPNRHRRSGAVYVWRIPLRRCEGRCDYCMAHLGTEEPIKSYADYSNFSDMQLNAVLDDIISNTAKELGEAAGRDIAALQAKAFA